MEESQRTWWDDIKGGQGGCGGDGGCGKCCCLVGYPWCIQDDEKHDDDVLDGKEKVFSICGEGIVVPVGVSQGYGIRKRFKDVC